MRHPVTECEDWRPIPGWVGAYEVSSLGRVRNAPKDRLYPGRVLRSRLTRKGYPSVRLMAWGKDAERPVHTLVAAAFLGPRPKGLQVDHIDGVKTNNQPANLQYVTCAENIRRAKLLGLRADIRGEDHGLSKLSVKDIRAIRAAWARGETQTSIGRRFAVTQANISEIVRRRTWTHV